MNWTFNLFISLDLLLAIKTAPLNPNRLTLTYCQGHSIEDTMYIDTNKASQSEPPYSVTSLVPLFMTDHEMWHKLSHACPIIMNFSEDWGVGMIYLPTTFQLNP